jgi:hypothetical protein
MGECKQKVSFQSNSGGKTESPDLGIVVWKEGKGNSNPKVWSNSLEIQAPELLARVLQLEAKFPTAAAFVATPHQNRFAHILIRHVNQVQSLPDGKSLRHDREASFGADVDRVTLGVERTSGLCPGNGHRNARIQANSRADSLHPLFET